MTATRLLLAVTLVSVSFCVVVTKADEAKKTKLVKASVTDREDNPIEGARVVKLNWFELDPENIPEVLTNAEGEFEFPLEISDDDDKNASKFVIIYKDGYAVSALNLDALPARARLWPKKPVAVRIVDADQRPIEGARVTLGELGFNEEFLHANVPPSLAEHTGVTSRQDGWAILRSTRPEFLHSVIVEAEGFGSQTFVTQFAKAKFNLLQLWETTPAEVTVMRGKDAASGWTVMATSNDFFDQRRDGAEFKDKNPLNGAILPKGISFIGVTDQEGKLSLPHALVRRTVKLLLIDSDNQWRGSGEVFAIDDQPNLKTIRMEPSLEESGEEYSGQVLDTHSGEPVAGVELTLQLLRQMPPIHASAVSGEDGRFVIKAKPGTWHVSAKKVPETYCETLTTESQIVIPDKGERVLPEVRVPKGRTITGRIEGIDLSIRRARWIHVYWSEGDGESGQLHGWFQPDGTFEVKIPEAATADEFKIVSVGGGSGNLEIKSRDPLVLTGVDTD